MPNFASAIQKAIDKVASIEGFGQNVTIRTITAGSYNTTTGVISESNSDATVKAVFEDVNMREVNELIQAEDKKLLYPLRLSRQNLRQKIKFLFQVLYIILFASLLKHQAEPIFHTPYI